MDDLIDLRYFILFIEFVEDDTEEVEYDDFVTIEMLQEDNWINLN